ncbi:hypothetical protein ACN24K_37415 [Streptomyces microflavus]
MTSPRAAPQMGPAPPARVVGPHEVVVRPAARGGQHREHPGRTLPGRSGAAAIPAAAPSAAAGPAYRVTVRPAWLVRRQEASVRRLSTAYTPAATPAPTSPSTALLTFSPMGRA